jgi:diguanylate cyclase (GGDEF)-like protein
MCKEGVDMKQKSRFGLRTIAVTAFAVVALLFVVFAVCMWSFKENNVYSARDIASYKTVQDCSSEEIEDMSAPVGVRREYRWKIGDMENNESCLMFYIVHSYAEVRFDDELIYSIESDGNTRTGISTSSNWVVIPLRQSDVGRQVTVTVTPVYKSAVNRVTEFKIGSRYAVFMQRLKADLPQIVLSSLCIIMGILLITVQLCFIANKRTSAFDMLYIGIVSLLMGIWRITDTRFSPIIFEGHTGALGYITLSALFLVASPLLLFADERHMGKFHIPLRCSAIATSAVALGALVLQVAGVAELRETLPACHIMIIADIAVLLLSSVFNIRTGSARRDTVLFVGLLIAGSIIDFVYFYINDTSSGNMFTLTAFLIYTLYLFTDNILDINRKAYTDPNTQLYNKARWEEFINNSIPAGEPIGVMMLDLNSLKRTNDTLGHKAGDKMILRFSEILRNTFAPGEFLCRWGGDEFAVIVRNADREKMENYNNAVHSAVEDYNSKCEKPKIYFACGYALSEEFSYISRSELLKKADERMYRDKQQWYSEHTVSE